jgi:hypothetical protein
LRLQQRTKACRDLRDSGLNEAADAAFGARVADDASVLKDCGC